MTFDLLPKNIILQSPDWAPVAFLLLGIIALLVVINYWRMRAAWWVKCLGVLLKLTALVLLAACIVQPMVQARRPRPQANLLPILVDDSRSMQLKADRGDRTRGESVQRWLDRESGWMVRVAQDFDVRPYRFAARLDQMADPADLTFDGGASTLRTSLVQLQQRFARRPMAGVVLMTDGNATDDAVDGFQWDELGFPVYPVVPDSVRTPDDLRINSVAVRQTDFETSPVTVTVSAQASDDDLSEIQMRLIDCVSGTVVAEQSVAAGADGRTFQSRFQFRPQQSGVNFYEVSVFDQRDRDRFPATVGKPDSDEAETASRWEATLLNNRRLVAVDRRGGPYRVLYMAGRPNWDFKFMRRALQEDAEIDLVGLLRIANKEPKFTFRDSTINETNPLFAGLGQDEEETAEQYDEPVVIRLGIKDSDELSDGFPDTAEELFAYHAVILDDIEPTFFTADQLLLLRRFVAARGGALMLMGGAESFGASDFANTPLGEMSPVYAPRRAMFSDERSVPKRDRKLELTREGMLSPWVRLRDNESAERQRLDRMPAFRTVNPVGDIKPGAQTMLMLRDEDGNRVPGLVVQRFGNGRTAAWTIADAWRWSMRRDRSANDDPGQAWRQTTHWLVGEVPRRVQLQLEGGRSLGSPVQITVDCRDAEYLPLDNASIDLKVQQQRFGTTDKPAKQAPDSLDVQLQPSETEPGKYVGRFWPRAEGAYRFTADVQAEDGSPVGRAETGWVSRSDASEFERLAWDRDGLAEIARQTGGEVISAGDLSSFSKSLPNRKVPVTEIWQYPLWHQPWVLCIAMACLCGEWTLRRWQGAR
ncbi:glutamine amidotransferase [Crateriforma spongiae]|uniref:glutamine amidotransferase n=1 Tax=Crateriforma spongiae TaxID=2724528 RepID=UPI001446440C|nr:glutamine amidotransferase [Crateriforma spongiae]